MAWNQQTAIGIREQMTSTSRDSMHGRAAKPKRTKKKLNENQNKETNSGKKTVEKSGEKANIIRF